MEYDNRIECKSCSKEVTDKINTLRFIDKLDNYFSANDLQGAKKHIEFWENEARAYNDSCGLLTVLNEKIGFARKINDEDMALSSIQEAKQLINDKGLLNNPSGATICVNIATTLKAFNKADESLDIYSKAKKVYEDNDLIDSYEYAALLNNEATALCDLQRYDEAENNIMQAYDILNAEGKYDGEIGVSLVNLAHLIYDRNEEDIDRVEKTLNIAIEYLDSQSINHDGAYAYILEKCVPSFRYFKRDNIADKYEAIAKQIYKK